MLDLLKEHIASLNYGWVSFVFEVLIVIFAIIAISIILVTTCSFKTYFHILSCYSYITID